MIDNYEIMTILVTLLILLGLPFIIYFSIKTLQFLAREANLKSIKGILITMIVVIALLSLIYFLKWFFVGLSVVLLLPFILLILLDAENRLFTNNETSLIEKIYTSIPFPLLIFSYILFFITAVWMTLNASNPRLFAFVIIGGVWGLAGIIKKKKSVKEGTTREI